MSVVITGAAGFLGNRLARNLAKRGTKVVLCDQVVPSVPPGCRALVGPLSDTLGAAITKGTTHVVHLAAVVSTGAEQDFDLGYRVNVDGLTRTLERCRKVCARPPIFVFASSLAVFGATKDADDDTPCTPLNSYGTQKAVGELLVNDYSRKGFVDGRSLRLPTIAIRPGAPNAAASGFASSILREPLANKRAVCPMAASTQLWLASPRSALRSLEHALDVDGSAFGAYRCVNAPGVTVSVEEMLCALERHGGDRGLVDFKMDPAVAAIVGTWPARFTTARAEHMGFPAADSLEDMILNHIEDELTTKF